MDQSDPLPKPIIQSNAKPISKRERLYNSRLIRADLDDPAFTNPPKGKNVTKKVIESQILPNKLDVPMYLQARENEIMVLEQAMIKSKSIGSTRIFQNLPRSMRRRTASHNVKRIPKRMRWKALKEMGINPGDATQETPIGTKGVTRSGRPINKKQNRGRLRFRLQRKIKLLKYALKWKLNGKLLDGTWVDLKNIKIGEKIKLLRNQLSELKDEPMDLDEPQEPMSLEELERYQSTKAINGKLQNQTGAHDNTGVNSQAKVHKITSLKYSTRQRDFKWLPTHVWHAKRAKIIKRWNWSIPYSPTQKCFRNTSRSSRQNGCIAQDTSFIGTTIINGPNQESLLGFVKKFTNNKASRGKWLKLAWEGLSFIDDEPIGNVQILWSKNKERYHLILRSHPAIHTKVYFHALNFFNGIENVTVHDCKFSIGSIDLMGPKAMSVLQTILHKRNLQEGDENETLGFDSFMKLFKLNDINSIPDGTSFCLDVADPRFWTYHNLPPAPQIEEDLIDIIISLRKSNLNGSKLFNINDRNLSYKNQLSNKLLDARRRENIGRPIPLETSDPKIPIVIYKINSKWSMMVPWFWVLPFWYTIMHIPHVQLGCLKQMEQIKFERSQLGWGDFVFTFDGFIQCQIENDILKSEWEKRPRSKRVEYSKLRLSSTELGETLSPFGLDWRGVQVIRLANWRINKFGSKISNQREIKKDKKLNLVPDCYDDIYKVVKAIKSSEDQFKEMNNHGLLVKHMPIKLYMEKNENSPLLFQQQEKDLCFNIISLPPLDIVPIKFECLTIGHAKSNARIYILPEDQEYKLGYKQDEDELNIIGKPVKYRATFDVPHIKYLVGLVSSSTFNLTKGKSTGIGFIDANILSHNPKLLLRNVSSEKPVQISWSQITL